jgi:hypothetical protein
MFIVCYGARAFVRREVNDVKIIAPRRSGRQFKTSCLIELDRPSDGKLAWIFRPRDALVPGSFREGFLARDNDRGHGLRGGGRSEGLSGDWKRCHQRCLMLCDTVEGSGCLPVDSLAS